MLDTRCVIEDRSELQLEVEGKAVEMVIVTMQEILIDQLA